MSDQLEAPLEITEVQSDEYAEVADLLTGAFTFGKYIAAFGRDPAQRAALFEILLRHKSLSKGVLYVTRIPGNPRIVGTVVVKYENPVVSEANRQAARAEVAAKVGPLRAWWAMTVLRFASSPHLEPHQCYMDDLVINPEFRRQRIAQRILYATFDISREKGKTEMIADLIPTNKGVIGLIRATHWEIVGTNYLSAIMTLPLFGYAGVRHVRRDLTKPNIIE